MVKVIGTRERLRRQISFEVKLGEHEFHTFHHDTTADETFVLLAIEGTLLKGDADMLKYVSVDISVHDRISVRDLCAAKITPSDPVADARLRWIEEVLALVVGQVRDPQIVNAVPEHPSLPLFNDAAQVLRRHAMRAGYGPQKAITDHRVLPWAVLLPAKHRLRADVRRRPTPGVKVDPEALWRLTLTGIETRLVL